MVVSPTGEHASTPLFFGFSASRPDSVDTHSAPLLAARRNQWVLGIVMTGLMNLQFG